MLPRNDHPDPNLIGWPLPYDLAERRGWPPGYTVRIVRPGWYDLVRLPTAA
jgi:hypothetical protein